MSVFIVGDVAAAVVAVIVIIIITIFLLLLLLLLLYWDVKAVLLPAAKGAQTSVTENACHR